MHVSVQSQRKNELFSDLVDNLKSELVGLEIQDDKALQIAEKIIFNVYENWRGISVVFPMNPKSYIDKLKSKILDEFNGRNSTELVRKYKISENILYRWNREKLLIKR